MEFSGGCQCGAVRYRISGELGKASICHCRMCQKAFGNVCAPLVEVSPENLTWTRGQPAVFRSSSVVNRGFCGSCGTPLFMQEDKCSWEIAIGTLDQPELVKVTIQSGVESKLSWFDCLHALASEKTSDYRCAEELARLTSRQHPDHHTRSWQTPMGEESVLVRSDSQNESSDNPIVFSTSSLSIDGKETPVYLPFSFEPSLSLERVRVLMQVLI
jgi:hypothetical protein